MRKLLLYSVAILMVVFLSSCTGKGPENLQQYERQKVTEVISTHDTTILYFMTSWCQASQSDFERNMKPYLGKASDTKAIVLVCLGEVEQVSSLGNRDENVMVCIAPSRNPLLDKMFINKECRKLLSRYKRVNYVPVGLVCNRNGEILNWCANEASGRTYESIYLYL